MRGTAMALVVVAVAAAGDAAAQMLDRTSRPPASAVQAAGWTDHPIRPGVTSIKTAHFEELRARIAALRAREGLPPVRWTDGLPGRRRRRVQASAGRAVPGRHAEDRLPAEAGGSRRARCTTSSPPALSTSGIGCSAMRPS